MPNDLPASGVAGRAESKGLETKSCLADTVRLLVGVVATLLTKSGHIQAIVHRFPR
jgi:hypothetical protein